MGYPQIKFTTSHLLNTTGYVYLCYSFDHSLPVYVL